MLAHGRGAARLLLVCSALVLLTLSVMVYGLFDGDIAVTWSDVASVVSGAEQGFPRTVLIEWRLPRVVAAATIGAALGVSGAIFQVLTRNVLATPDLLGFSSGAFTGGVLASVASGATFAATALGALGGGVVTALLVYLLAFRNGITGLRLIIVGICVGAVMNAISTWVLLRAQLEVAIAAGVWGSGSLQAVRLPATLILVAVAAVLLLGLAVIAPSAKPMELGEDIARTLGVRVESTRAMFLAVGIGLTAVCTAVAGPIVFVSLVAPQIGRRLARTSGVSLWASGCAGAAIVVTGDLIARRLAVPVGVVTLVVGGAFLLFVVLGRQSRSS